MTRRHTALIAATLAVVAAFVLAACGDDDSDADVGTADAPRTVDIDMVDIGFEPDNMEVRAGETVRFVFHNEGAIEHDAFIGDQAAQDDHEAEMRELDDMDDMGDDEGGMGHEDEEGAISVEPGESGEFTHTFSDDEDIQIGCHEPGHYVAGMTISIDVIS